MWIEVFYGEGKASVPALLLLHSCWHPVACQHNYTARCMLRNLLSSNEIIKVTAAFQGMSVNLTDIDVLFFLCDFLEGKININEKNGLFENTLQDSAWAVTVLLRQVGPGSSFGKHKWSQQKTQRRNFLWLLAFHARKDEASFCDCKRHLSINQFFTVLYAITSNPQKFSYTVWGKEKKKKSLHTASVFCKTRQFPIETNIIPCQIWVPGPWY